MGMQCDKCLQYRSNFREHNCIVDEIESLRKQVEMLEEALKVLKVAVNDKMPDLGATLYIARILTRLNTMREGN